jgi:hypothetical protein
LTTPHPSCVLHSLSGTCNQKKTSEKENERRRRKKRAEKKERDASPSEKKTSDRPPENIEKKTKKSLLDNFTTVLGSPLLVWDLEGLGFRV